MLLFSGVLAFGQNQASRAFPNSVTIINNLKTDSSGRPLGADKLPYRTASVNVGDLNGDGHLDIVMANGRHQAQDNRVVLGRGNGTFMGSYLLGGFLDNSYAAELVDMDHDGDLDVVVSNDNSSPPVVNSDSKLIHTNGGTGTFTRTTFGDYRWPTRYASVADLNGDGWTDIVMANRFGTVPGPSYICYGSPGGTINPNCVAFHQGSTTKITPADIDMDGWIDLIVPARDGGQGYIYLNDGSGGFPLTLRRPFGPSVAYMRAVEAADFDRDGFLDLAAINQTGTMSLATMRGAPGLMFDAMKKVDSGNTTNQIPYGLTVVDIDRNGLPDLVVGYLSPSSKAASISPSVYFNDGGGVYTRVLLGGSQLGSVYGFGTGDFNKDGYLDIAVARSLGISKVYFGAK